MEGGVDVRREGMALMGRGDECACVRACVRECVNFKVGFRGEGKGRKGR